MIKLIRNKKGQGALEYIMISALIGVACLTVFKTFGQTLEKKMHSMNKRVISTVKMW